MIIVIGLTANWLDLHADGNKYWIGICKHEKKQPRLSMLFHLQVGNMSLYLVLEWEAHLFYLTDFKVTAFLVLVNQALLVGLSSVMVFLSTSHRTEKQELHVIHQLMNWSIAGIYYSLFSGSCMKIIFLTSDAKFVVCLMGIPQDAWPLQVKCGSHMLYVHG